jgi:YbbR domain-containing protein
VTAKRTWREHVRAAFLENLGLKILSLVVAIGFFGFIHGAERAQRTFLVSLVTVPPPDSANRTLMTQLPTEIAVTLRGSRAQLDDLRAEDLGTVRLDLSSGTEDVIHFDETMFRVPPGMSVEQIYPPKVSVRFDDVITRQIPVQIARTGEPAEGFTVKGSTAVEPETVTAEGPRSVIDVIQYARAAPFDVSGLKEGTYRRPLALNAPPALASFDVQSVTATVDIVRELRSTTYRKLKVEVVGAPTLTTQPRTVNVKVTGTPEEVNSLAPESVVPHVKLPEKVDLSEPGSAYADVTVELPEGISAEVEPAKVVVKWGVQ